MTSPGTLRAVLCCRCQRRRPVHGRRICRACYHCPNGTQAKTKYTADQRAARERRIAHYSARAALGLPLFA